VKAEEVAGLPPHWHAAYDKVARSPPPPLSLLRARAHPKFERGLCYYQHGRHERTPTEAVSEQGRRERPFALCKTVGGIGPASQSPPQLEPPWGCTHSARKGGIYKTVRARLWPWLSADIYNGLTRGPRPGVANTPPRVSNPLPDVPSSHPCVPNTRPGVSNTRWDVSNTPHTRVPQQKAATYYYNKRKGASTWTPPDPVCSPRFVNF